MRFMTIGPALMAAFAADRSGRERIAAFQQDNGVADSASGAGRAPTVQAVPTRQQRRAEARRGDKAWASAARSSAEDAAAERAVRKPPEPPKPCARCGRLGCLGDGRDVRIDPRTGDRTIMYCGID